jgi:hypothetical protein
VVYDFDLLYILPSIYERWKLPWVDDLWTKDILCFNKSFSFWIKRAFKEIRDLVGNIVFRIMYKLVFIIKINKFYNLIKWDMTWLIDKNTYVHDEWLFYICTLNKVLNLIINIGFHLIKGKMATTELCVQFCTQFIYLWVISFLERLELDVWCLHENCNHE